MKLLVAFGKSGLGTQLACVFIFMFVVVIAVAGLFYYQHQINTAKTDKRNGVNALSKSVVAAISEDLHSGQYTKIEYKLSGLSRIDEIQSITIYGNNKMIVSEVSRDDEGGLTPTYRYGKSEFELADGYSNFLPDESLVVIQPIWFSGSILGWVKFRTSPDVIKQVRKSVLSDYIIFNGLVLICACVTIVLFLKYRLRAFYKLEAFSRTLPLVTGATIQMTNSPREFFILMESLNWASQQIFQQRLELENQNKMLEQRVIERTKEIELAKNAAEEANEAKSVFLSRMSHELRTPMNAILGFAQMLELDASQLNELHQESVQEILVAGAHLLELINEVLDLSKIESGQLDVEPEEIDISEIIEICIRTVTPDAMSRNIIIINKMEDQKNIMVYVDPVRIKQVILNLLSNAIKYNVENGTVILDCTKVNQDKVRICVTDTGDGLTGDDQEKLFIPFERLGVEKKVDGVGIGLVISKQLIEKMDGNIGVESSPGNGSTFWVELQLIEKTVKQ